jgi:hypothetical protein
MIIADQPPLFLRIIMIIADQPPLLLQSGCGGATHPCQSLVTTNGPFVTPVTTNLVT